MGFFARLLRRDAAVELVRRNRRALLRFRLGGGLVPYAQAAAAWPELAPLESLATRPESLENPLPEDRVPEALEAVLALSRDTVGLRGLSFAVSKDFAPAPAPDPTPPAEAAPSSGAEDDGGAPEAGPGDGEAFFRDARALLGRKGSPAEPAPFSAAYPRYALLSEDQLRWYLWLRECLGRGEYPDTPYAYLLLRIYELVNGLGVDAPCEGLDALVALWRSYRDRCPELLGAPARWIWDYAQVYSCGIAPGELLAALPGLPDLAADAVLTALEESGAPLRLPAELLGRLSGYDVGASRFFQRNPEALGQLSDAVAAVDAALREACGEGILSAHSLSRVRSQEVAAFRGAPVAAERRYTLRRRRCLGSPRLAAWLAPLLRYIENGLRARYRFSGRLKGAEPDAFARAAVDAWLAQLTPDGAKPDAPRPAPRLTLDMADVLRLRAESDAVRDALLAAVAEDADDGPIPWEDPPRPAAAEGADTGSLPEAVSAAPGAAPSPSTASAEPSPAEVAAAPDSGAPDPDLPAPWRAFLARADREALAALLEGPDALRALARRRGRMPASLLDALNEAASDTLGDLIASEDGVYEEYADMLRTCLGRPLPAQRPGPE